MSEDKNFNIIRSVNNPDLTVGDFKVGDVFEREGSLHMRIHPTGLLHIGKSTVEAVVCNLNTGSAWVLPADTVVFKCHNLTIEYQVEK
jgi:hypothetical protein